jgi:hypothetical protein
LLQITLVRRSTAPVAALSLCFEEHPMLDLILLAGGLGFFALSVGYAYVCDSL